MKRVRLRPDLRTSGGEMNDILLDDQFAGVMTLVYREKDRLCGSLQMDTTVTSKKHKTLVIDFVREYVDALVEAMHIPQSDVIVTFSEYDRIFETGYDAETEDEADVMEWRENEETPEIEYDVLNKPRFIDVDPDEFEEMTMDEEDQAAVYELVIVGEKRNQVEYHVYDHRQRWVAEAFFTLQGPDVVGEVSWVFDPTDEEIEAITDLIVSDFDDQVVESFTIDMMFQDELLETIDLTREDLMDEGEPIPEAEDRSNDYTIVLSRDDGDALTYDIYRPSNGGLPIASAMIDIRFRDVTGYIDYQQPTDEEERSVISAILMKELDKERDFNSLNLTMIYQNQPFEELHFEAENVH